MQAWFSETSASLTQQASSSVQKLSEQADLAHIGDRVFASAQVLVENTEAAFEEARQHVIRGASTLNTFPLLAEPKSTLPNTATLEERVAWLRSEVTMLDTKVKGGTVPHDIFQLWQRRLSKQKDSDDTVEIWTKAMHMSKAVPGAVKALTSDDAGITFLSAAAKALPGAVKALTSDDVGITFISAGAMAASGSGSTSAEGQTALSFVNILLKTSHMSDTLLSQLLRLVADAARNRKKGREIVSCACNMFEAAATCSADEIALRSYTISREAADAAMASVAHAITAVRAGNVGDESRQGRFELGDTVWAEWLGDGVCYMARVSSVTDGELKLAWLSPPYDVEFGGEAQYLSSVGDNNEAWTQLPASLVSPMSLPRPQIVVSSEAKDWQNKLSIATKLFDSFNDLWVAATLLDKNIEVRVGPAEEALNTTLSSLEGVVAAVPSAAQLRRECSMLGEKSITSELMFNPSPTGDPHIDGLANRVAELLQERSELLEKFREVDNRLAHAREDLRLAQRQGVFKDQVGIESVKKGIICAKWDEEEKRLRSELNEVSKGVVTLLQERISQIKRAAGSFTNDCTDRYAKACVLCELLRRRQLEDLVRCVRAAAWGSETDTILRDPPRLAELKSLIGRVGNLSDFAWREMVQLAASSLGSNEFKGLSSEDMTQAAKRYKEIRSELNGSVGRLESLEEAVPQK